MKSALKTRQGEGGLLTRGTFKSSLPGKPLVTVITAVYNGERHLEETIRRITDQTYENIEYIIVDGGSTDGTLDIIRKYEHVIDYWVSEQDRGISDAFNKGVLLARGDYLNFQGDGDGFSSQDAVSRMMEHIDPAKDWLISGRIERVSLEGDVLFVSKHAPVFNKHALLLRMALPHQGLFTHRDYFRRYGLFDVNNTYCMDYDHLLRAYADFPNVVMKDVIVAQWRADGLGNNKTLEILREYDRIKRSNRVAGDTLLALIHLWILAKHSIKKLIGRV